MKYVRENPVVCLFVFVLALLLLMSLAVPTDASDGQSIPSVSVVAQVDMTQTGTYISREYKYILVRTRFESAVTGYLFRNSKPIMPEPWAKVNAIADSPWGVMFWHGITQSNRQPEGWMPYPNLYGPNLDELN